MSHLAGPTPTSSPMTPPRTTPNTPDTPSTTSDPKISQHDNKSDFLIQFDNGADYNNGVSIAEGAQESLGRCVERLTLAEFDRHSSTSEDRGRARMQDSAPEIAPLRSRSVDHSVDTPRKEFGFGHITEMNESENDASEGATEKVYDTSESESGEQSQDGPKESPDYDINSSGHTATVPIHARPSRGEPLACLFVASLSASRTDAQLFESVSNHFSQWGKLMHVKVLKDWMNRPYSFVQFERVEEAQRAMVEAQNTIIDGRHIRIEQARVNRTLFILRFSRSTTEQDIRKILEEYGSVEDVSILHDSSPSGSRRYALARFAYRDDAIKAFVTLRASSHWAVEWAPNTNTSSLLDRDAIFVGQLNPAQVTKEALRERFEQYGNIKGITLLNRGRLGTRAPIAYAFIEYSSDREASEAIEHENNTEFQGHTISVQYRETNEYRLQRQSYLQQAHAAQSMSSMYFRAIPLTPLMPHSSIDAKGTPLGSGEDGHADSGRYQTYPEQSTPVNTATHHSHSVYYGPPQPPIPSLYVNYHNPYGTPLYSSRGVKEDRGGYSQTSAGPADCAPRLKQVQALATPQSHASTRLANTFGATNQETPRDQVAGRVMTGMNPNPYEYSSYVQMDPYYSYGAQPVVMYDYPHPVSPSAYCAYPAAGYYYPRPMPSPHTASTTNAGGHEIYLGPHGSAASWHTHHGPGGCSGGGGSKTHRPSSQGCPNTSNATHQESTGGSKDTKS